MLFRSPDDDVLLEVDSNLYKLVKVNRDARTGGVNRRYGVTSSYMRKYAEHGFRVQNQHKPSAFKHLSTDEDLSDAGFERMLQAASSEELEEEETIKVLVHGRNTTHCLIHSKAYPIWTIKGLCYMATLKDRTLPVFKWDKYITMRRLAGIDKNFRKDAKFYVTEKDSDGLFHISLVMVRCVQPQIP